MAQGGKREGAGRKLGVPNKVTAEVMELAGKYGPKAVDALAVLAGLKADGKAKPAESDAARVAALKEILDRAYGKATQTIAGDPEHPLKTVQEIVLRGVRSDSRD